MGVAANSYCFVSVALPLRAISLLQHGGPSHRKQSFIPNWILPMGCSSLQTAPLDPFHGAQSFRNKPLQPETCRGSQVLPSNLLQRGILSLHNLPGAFSPMVSPWSHSFLQSRSTCSSMRLSRGYRWISVPLWISTGCRVTATSPWPSPQAARESLLWHLKHILLLLLPLPCCLQSSVSYIFSLLSPAAVAQQFFLLKSVIVEVLLPLWMGSASARSKSVLESAANVSIRHGGSFWHCLISASHTWSPPDYLKPSHNRYQTLKIALLTFQKTKIIELKKQLMISVL